MWPFRIVGMNIVPNQLPKLLGRLIFIRVNLFRLQTAEPALNHDIICLAALPIHTLPDLKAFQQSLLLRTGKLTPLIGVQDSRNFMHCYRFFDGMNDGLCIECVGKVMANNFAAVPVNNGS